MPMSKSWRVSPMLLLGRALAGLVAALLVGGACAAPVVGGTLAGQRGDTLTLNVGDTDLQDFEAASIEILFDASVLSFTGARADLAAGDVLANPISIGRILLSIISGTGPVSGAQALYSLSFEINAAAAFGDSVVSFASLEPDLYGVAPFRAIVNVVDPGGGAVPTAPTLALALAALALLPATAGRRSRARRSA